jgi:hypothetical protein
LAVVLPAAAGVALETVREAIVDGGAVPAS